MNLTNAELSDFFSEMEGLLRAGIPLTEHDGGAQANRRLKRLWSTVSLKLTQGQSLSASLESDLAEASPETLALIRAGEESGDLLTPLRIAAESHRRILALERCMRLSFFYPMIVLLFAMGVLLFYGWIILPNFRETMAGMGSGDIFPTGRYPAVDLAKAAGTPLGTAITLMLAAGLMILINSNAWMSPFIRTHILGNIPTLGRIMAFGAITRWTHVVGHLLRTRVSMDTAMVIAQGTLQFKEQREAAEKIRGIVSNGQPLSIAMLNVPLLPRAAAGVISSGEKAGTVDDAMLSLSDHYQERLDHDTQRFLVWLEPLLILFVGIIVMAFIVSLFLPLFDLPRLITRF